LLGLRRTQQQHFNKNTSDKSFIYVIDESAIKTTLVFCLICSFVQIKVKQ